jgi:hypothetical protein
VEEAAEAELPNAGNEAEGPEQELEPETEGESARGETEAPADEEPAAEEASAEEPEASEDGGEPSEQAAVPAGEEQTSE